MAEGWLEFGFSPKIVAPKGTKLEFNVFNLIEKELGYEVKYVQKEHLKTLATLGVFKEHTDPSDRLIIAQAITEKLSLISSDNYFRLYKKLGLYLIRNHK